MKDLIEDYLYRKKSTQNKNINEYRIKCPIFAPNLFDVNLLRIANTINFEYHLKHVDVQ